MKVAVIGASGQLGSDLCQELAAIKKTERSDLSQSLVPLTHSEIEIADLSSVKQALEKYCPDVVINTAAFHRVDECEDDPDTAFRVNTLGARNVAVVVQELGVKLVHISTDYIFGGENKPSILPYTEFDTPMPANLYGESKLAGENLIRHLCLKHFIVRSSGLFGVSGSSGKGGNFVETMLRLARERDELRVVNDQVFSPTFTKDLARKIVQLIGTEYFGIFHITNSKSCPWYDFTREILRLAGLKTPVIPITSAQYPQKAKRPGYSVLANYHLRLLGMDDMRPWQEALEDYLWLKGHLPGG